MSDDVCAQTYLWARICARHNRWYEEPECPKCVAERQPAATPAQRDTLNVLEARIADQADEITALRRRVTELEHGRIAGQRAHNALADQVERMAALLLNLEEMQLNLEKRMRP